MLRYDLFVTRWRGRRHVEVLNRIDSCTCLTRRLKVEHVAAQHAGPSHRVGVQRYHFAMLRVTAGGLACRKCTRSLAQAGVQIIVAAHANPRVANADLVGV